MAGRSSSPSLFREGFLCLMVMAILKWCFCHFELNNLVLLSALSKCTLPLNLHDEFSFFIGLRYSLEQNKLKGRIVQFEKVKKKNFKLHDFANNVTFWSLGKHTIKTAIRKSFEIARISVQSERR